VIGILELGSGSGLGLGWVGRLVSLVGGWSVGDVFLWSFFVLCLCFYVLALYFDPCFWYVIFWITR